MTGVHLLEALPGQLHGEIRDQNVTVSGGPSLLPADPLPKRKKVIVDNAAGETIWLGGSAVSPYTGVPLAAGAQIDLPLGRSKLYATTTGATVSGVHILEIA